MITAGQMRDFIKGIADDEPVPFFITYAEVWNKYVFARLDETIIAGDPDGGPPAINLVVSLLDDEGIYAEKEARRDELADLLHDHFVAEKASNFPDWISWQAADEDEPHHCHAVEYQELCEECSTPIDYRHRHAEGGAA